VGGAQWLTRLLCVWMATAEPAPERPGFDKNFKHNQNQSGEKSENTAQGSSSPGPKMMRRTATSQLATVYGLTTLKS